MPKDIATNLKFGDFCIAVCNHYCKNKPKKCNFYDWFTYLDHKFIKRMCENCALRERWGIHFKQRKDYKAWAGSLYCFVYGLVFLWASSPL